MSHSVIQNLFFLEPRAVQSQNSRGKKKIKHFLSSLSSSPWQPTPTPSHFVFRIFPERYKSWLGFHGQEGVGRRGSHGDNFPAGSAISTAKSLHYKLQSEFLFSPLKLLTNSLRNHPQSSLRRGNMQVKLVKAGELKTFLCQSGNLNLSSVGSSLGKNNNNNNKTIPCSRCSNVSHRSVILRPPLTFFFLIVFKL